MSYESIMMQQVDDEDQRWGGHGSGSGTGWGSHGGRDRSKAAGESSAVQEVDRSASRSGGGSGGEGGYRGGFAATLTLNTANRSGNVGDLTLFSPSDLFPASPQQPLQQAASPFSWQTLLGGQSSARWQPDAAMQGFAMFEGNQPRVQQASSTVNAYAQGEENVRRVGVGGQNEQCLAHEDDGVLSEVDVNRSVEVKEAWTENVNSEKEDLRNLGGMSLAFY